MRSSITIRMPAAAAGIDIASFLDLAASMVRACGADVPPAENPGIQLGLALAAAHRAGRDKLTLSASAQIADFGAWAEQLIAESTGKNGKAIIPLADETLGKPEVYGKDRFFIDLRLNDDRDAAREASLSALEKAGHPVVRIAVTSAVGCFASELTAYASISTSDGTRSGVHTGGWWMTVSGDRSRRLAVSSAPDAPSIAA